MSTSRLPLVALLVVGLLATGCAAPGDNYFSDRGRDLTDIVDVKWSGSWDSYGLGVKAEATNYLGAGVGYGAANDLDEKYGRRWDHSDRSVFVHMLAWGYDGPANDPGASRSNNEYYVLGINGWQERRPAMFQRWRVGGEIIFMPLNLGLYLNLAEVGDFLTGIVTYDWAEDDMLEFGADL